MYDLVFITHLPAFYKTNFYTELARSKKILVIFLGKKSNIRSSDFLNTEFEFNTLFLSRNNFEARPRLFSSMLLFIRLLRIDSKQYLVGGWEEPEFWLTVLLKKRKRNALILESSILDSSLSGGKSLLKKFMLRRVSTVFASGKPHVDLLCALNYSGVIVKTLGVGLINTVGIPVVKQNRTSAKHYIYVGRLSKEKNIQLLVNAFHHLPDLTLDIVGYGPLEAWVVNNKSSNVNFLGEIVNSELHRFFINADALILPSIREPWGLVVEEALHLGLPVVCSYNVGCSYDLVLRTRNGLCFNAESEASFINALKQMQISSIYTNFLSNVNSYSIIEKNQSYLNCFSCE